MLNFKQKTQLWSVGFFYLEAKAGTEYMIPSSLYSLGRISFLFIWWCSTTKLSLCFLIIQAGHQSHSGIYL